MMDEDTAQWAADRIALLFQLHANADYIGEPVSILEHSWQAYEAAKKDDAPTKVQVASLLHDVGHMLGMEAGYPIGMDGCGIENHEKIGGDFLLSLGCHPYTAWLVSNHVNAKRFLVWKDPNYELSDASRTTLQHQGGPMTDHEAKAFMAVEGYEQALQMRSYDEAAKRINLPKPMITNIKEIVRLHVLENLKSGEVVLTGSSNRYYKCSTEQKRFYEENGYLVVKGHPLTSGKRCESLMSFVVFAFLVLIFVRLCKGADLDKMATALATNPTKDMLIHHEEVDDKTSGETRVQICRVENFSAAEGWKEIFDLSCEICGELFNEPAILFKDKLNYKLPGGGGFLAHQDATAYKPEEFASTHISVMIAVDPAYSEEVGPLHFAKGRHREGVFSNVKGVINKDVEDSMDFKPLYADPGDIVFFSSYIPHRSNTNRSNKPRRLGYLTYNKLSEGVFHNDYYTAKLESFKDGTGGTISINDDFGGKIVKVPH